ncbi:hypothetical protein [Nocardia tengchongensis]|uniref:hypothetical protein n=1 Tax=Nocardia tengchongensis TaxID=2055889 RepID=UPI003664E1BA
MARRISQSITPDAGEIETLKLPFAKKGARDPLQMRLRQRIEQSVPDFLPKLAEGEELTHERLLLIRVGLEKLSLLIEFLFKDDPELDAVLAPVMAASDAAQDMMNELAGARTEPFGGIDV